MKTGDDLSAIGVAGLGTGAALTAGIASACCVGPALAPVFLSVLGASGLATVSGLRPFTPWILLASGFMLAFSFWRAYRRPACAIGVTRVSPSLAFARVVTWFAAALWLVSVCYSIYGFASE